MRSCHGRSHTSAAGFIAFNVNSVLATFPGITTTDTQSAHGNAPLAKVRALRLASGVPHLTWHRAASAQCPRSSARSCGTAQSHLAPVRPMRSTAQSAVARCSQAHRSCTVQDAVWRSSTLTSQHRPCVARRDAGTLSSEQPEHTRMHAWAPAATFAVG